MLILRPRRYWPVIPIAAVFAVAVFLEWQVKNTPQPPLNAAAPQQPIPGPSVPTESQGPEQSVSHQTNTAQGDNSAQIAPTPPPKQSPEPDHWMIVPVPSPTLEAVWKLNTKTGELEFCFNTGVVKCNVQASNDPEGDKIIEDALKDFPKTK